MKFVKKGAVPQDQGPRNPLTRSQSVSSVSRPPNIWVERQKESQRPQSQNDNRNDNIIKRTTDGTASKSLVKAGQPQPQPKTKIVTSIEVRRIRMSDVQPGDIFLALQHRAPQNPGERRFHWMFYIHVGDETNKDGEIIHANNSEKYDYYWVFERKRHILLSERLACARRIGKLPPGWDLNRLADFLKEKAPVPYVRTNETKFRCRVYVVQCLLIMRNMKDTKITNHPGDPRSLEREMEKIADAQERKARECIVWEGDVPHFPRYVPLLQGYQTVQKEVPVAEPSGSSSRTRSPGENKHDSSSSKKVTEKPKKLDGKKKETMQPLKTT